MIEFSDISKVYPGAASRALRQVSFRVTDGETFVLVGSSGSGKSTLLKMVNRLERPTEGGVLLDERPIETYELLSLRRSIGYVFQGVGLFPHMRVEDNVGMVLRLLGWNRRRRRVRAQEVLEIVGLEPEVFARRFPRQLSGGQQQRVGVARALAAHPSYLLMDEPFGALDALSRGALQQELLTLKAGLARTILFVTHDISEALLLGDRIGVLHNGRLEQVGTPQEITGQPATAFVAQLFCGAGETSPCSWDAGS